MNATIVYQTVVKFQPPAPILAKFAAVDLTPDLEGIVAASNYPDFVIICEDVAAENPPGSGILQRTVKLRYSALFEQTFPTATEKMHQLRQFGLGILRSRMPGEVEIVAQAWEDNNCP
jgi:hypothetical protein